MNKCNTYYVLWLYANSAHKNTLDQVVGVLRIAKKNNIIERIKRLDTKVSVSGLKNILKSCLSTIVNMHLKDENNCVSGGKSIDKTPALRLKTMPDIKLVKLLKSQKDSSVKNVISSLRLKDTMKITVNRLMLNLFADSATSILEKVNSLFSSPSAWSNSHATIYDNGAVQHLMIENGEYKI